MPTLTNYLNLTGNSGNNVSTPNATPLQISGDLEITARINPKTYRPLADKAIINKHDAAGNQRGYRLVIRTTGVLRMTLSLAGTAGIDGDSTVAINENTTALWVRSTWRQSDGRVQFFTAPDGESEPTVWTQLGIDRTIAIASIFNCNQAVRIGASTTATEIFNGRIHRVILRSTTTRLDADFARAEQDVTSLFEFSGNNLLLSINRSGSTDIASIVGRPNKALIAPIRRLSSTGIARVTDGTAPTITKTNVPYFDGKNDGVAPGLFTPIFSTLNNIYYTLPINDAGTSNCRLIRLNKALVLQENVITRSTSYNQLEGGAYTFNEDPGHKQGAVAVDKNGLVVTFPEGHNCNWKGLHSTTAETLSTLAITATPVRANATTDASNYSYRRYFTNPFNGDLWMAHRGVGYYGYLKKWNETTKIWVPQGSDTGLTGYGAAFANSVYGMELVFASATVMYLFVEYSPNGTGYPRGQGTVIKSSDNGVNWTTMTDGRLTYPIKFNESHVCFPTPNFWGPILPGTVAGSTGGNLVQANITIDSAGNPLVFSAFRTEGDTARTLHISRWEPAKLRFEFHKILVHNAAIDIGNMSVMRFGARIYLLLSGLDEHTDPNWSVSKPYPGTGLTNKSPLWIMTSDDDGYTWNRYVLDDGLGVNGYWGGYFDINSMRWDSKIRIVPTCLTGFIKSEIWEFTLP